VSIESWLLSPQIQLIWNPSSIAIRDLSGHLSEPFVFLQ
jgi:hypothetical protein